MLQGGGLDGEWARTTKTSRRAVLAVGAAAALLYSSFALEVVLPGRHHWTVVVSVLEIPGNPIALPLRIADVSSGLLVLVFLPHVWAALPPGRWRTVGVSMTGLFAITNAGAALAPLPGAHAQACASTADQVQRWLHDGFSAASTASLALGAAGIALSVAHRRLPWLRRAGWGTFWVTSVGGSALLAIFNARDPASWGVGVSQRAQIALTSVWLFYLAYVATAGPQ